MTEEPRRLRPEKWLPDTKRAIFPIDQTFP